MQNVTFHNAKGHISNRKTSASESTRLTPIRQTEKHHENITYTAKDLKNINASL